MEQEQIEAEWLLALIDYSSGYDKEKARAELARLWLELARFDEWRDVALLESKEVARRIVEKHKDWGALRKAFC